MGVNLQKGQKVNLKKSDGQALSRIRIGLGWDPVEQKKGGLFGSIFGEIYRYNGEWKFNAIGQGTTDTGLSALARRYQ